MEAKAIIEDKKIMEILVKENYITSDDFKQAKNFADKNQASSIDYLLTERLITRELLGQAVAEFFNVPYVDLKKERMEESVFGKIPELVASSRGVIAFSKDDKGVRVGMVNPKDLEIIHLLEKRFGQRVIVYYITKQDLGEALNGYKGGLRDNFSGVINKLQDKRINREERDQVIVDLVDMLIKYGYQNRASDIHIEPGEKKVIVRYRVDGILHDVLEMPKDLIDFIVSRIKIMSSMRTDVHRSAQDGKISFEMEKNKIDVRVSILPVVHGENIVMRLLDPKQKSLTLSSLGLAGDDLQKVNKAAKKSHGMILVTGPTGAGKTTTLYAVLQILNKREVNISTIEDPVEYDIDGISQIQVNAKTNLTFAAGLRAIVRQDPDVIMVGEIRDEETASIAVNSSMTGHLVLSTLHTNDAATTLPRLLDMGVEEFLVVSTINVVIAQRLVRKICQKCRTSYSITPEEQGIVMSSPVIKKLFDNKGGNINDIRLYKGNGCKVCNFSGYSGRLGIFEVLEMSEPIREAVLRKASKDEIMRIAISSGMTTMVEDGVKKVFNGMTSFEEVMRVSRA
jgi:type II secretory ATPase GspE/PulE/Tfp pilus assembly ATPase PilB-like protein